MSRSYRLAVVVAALVALACAAPAAQADSIAYVKNGNVWLSTSDGARQFQVTSSGGYSDVSQADDGTMIGLNDVRLHRLDRAGNVQANFDTPVSIPAQPTARCSTARSIRRSLRTGRKSPTPTTT